MAERSRLVFKKSAEGETMRVMAGFMIVLTALTCMAATPSGQGGALDPKTFDFKALLGDPPADHSTRQQAEIRAVLSLQKSRTAEQEWWCQRERRSSIFVFSRLIGPSLNGSELPETAELMQEVSDQVETITDAAARVWNRPSPSQADRRVRPCVKAEIDGSYPSSEAVRGVLWATILGGIYPDQRAKLMEFGRRLGEDGVVAGSNYESDVVAGQKLGVEIARRLLSDDAFKARLEQVRDECQD
jgi:acid phosphatase (class A)